VDNPRARGFRRWLWAIVLAALAVRLTVCVELADTDAVVHPPRTTDMATYQALARDALRGTRPDVYYYQPFYYAVFLPAVYTVCGTGRWGPMVAQSALGAATALLVGLLAARLYGRRAGLVAAALLAAARLHTFYTAFTLVEVLQSFWIALLAVLALWAGRRGGLWRWGVTGFVAGLAVLTRGNALLLVPALLAVLAWSGRRQPRRLALGVPLFVLCLYLPQTPYIVHNSLARGRLTGPSTAADAVLALGNTPEAPPGIPGPTYYPPTWQAWMARANADGPAHRSVAAHMLEWMRREPLALPELKWRMFLLFWNPRELPNNVNIGVDGARSRLLRPFVLLEFGLIAPLALAGMLFDAPRARRSARRLFLHGLVWSLCLGTVLFYIIARLRLAVVPLLCVFAGVALDRLWRSGRAWRLAAAAAGAGPLSSSPSAFPARACRQRMLVSALAVAVAALFVYRAFPFYQAVPGPAVLRLARPHGVLAELPDGGRLLYDHGPLLVGGWESVELAPHGEAFTKTLSLPPACQGALAGGIRLAVAAEDAGEILVTVRHGGRTVSRQTCAVVARPGPQWLEAPFSPPLEVGGDELALDIRAAPRSPLRWGLVVDRFRDYGRTRFTERAPAGVGGEAVCELVLAPAAATFSGRGSR